MKASTNEYVAHMEYDCCCCSFCSFGLSRCFLPILSCLAPSMSKLLSLMTKLPWLICD